MIVHYYGAFNLTLMKSGYWSINMIRSLKYWQDQLHLVFDGLLSLDIDHMQQNCGHLMHLKSNNFVIVFVHDTFQELENLKQENRRLCEELKELRRTVQVGVLNVLIFPHFPPPPPPNVIQVIMKCQHFPCRCFYAPSHQPLAVMWVFGPVDQRSALPVASKKNVCAPVSQFLCAR